MIWAHIHSFVHLGTNTHVSPIIILLIIHFGTPPSFRYGLGTIYFRQEKYDLSEYHFKRALSITPTSSKLCCYLGMVLNANGRHEEVRRGRTMERNLPLLLWYSDTSMCSMC